MEKFKSLFEQKSFIIFLVIAIEVFIAYQIPDILMLFFVSFVIASALNPAVDYLAKKMPRSIAVLLIYLVGFFLLILFLFPLFTVAGKQIISLIKEIPAYASQLTIFLNNLHIVHKFTYKLPDFSQILSHSSSYAQEFFTSSLIAIGSFTGSVIIIFTSAMIILYMLLDRDYLSTTFLKFFPVSIRDRAEFISTSISRKVGGFVIGQFISLVAVGVLTAIGYLIIGLNYSLILGMISGVLDIIPIVGPVLSISLAVIVAIAQKPILVIWVVIIFTAIQWGTNVFLKPVVFSKFLDLHPLAIIFALLVAGTKLGVVGVIVAPAIAATVCVLIDELYLKKISDEVITADK